MTNRESFLQLYVLKISFAPSLFWVQRSARVWVVSKRVVSKRMIVSSIPALWIGSIPRLRIGSISRLRIGGISSRRITSAIFFPGLELVILSRLVLIIVQHIPSIVVRTTFASFGIRAASGYTTFNPRRLWICRLLGGIMHRRYRVRSLIISIPICLLVLLCTCYHVASQVKFPFRTVATDATSMSICFWH